MLQLSKLKKKEEVDLFARSQACDYEQGNDQVKSVSHNHESIIQVLATIIVCNKNGIKGYARAIG